MKKKMYFSLVHLPHNLPWNLIYILVNINCGIQAFVKYRKFPPKNAELYFDIFSDHFSSNVLSVRAETVTNNLCFEKVLAFAIGRMSNPLNVRALK